MFKCKVCSKPLRDIPCYRKRKKTCSRKCHGVWISMNAKKKSFIDNGYIRVLIPLKEQKGNYKYAMQHRLVMEQHLGRKLKDDEVVHHKNCNRSDNRISNLQVMTYAEHSLHHIPKKNGRWSIKFDKCTLCGRTDRPHQARGRCSFCYHNTTGIYGTRRNRWNKQISISSRALDYRH